MSAVGRPRAIAFPNHERLHQRSLMAGLSNARYTDARPIFSVRAISVGPSPALLSCFTRAGSIEALRPYRRPSPWPWRVTRIGARPCGANGPWRRWHPRRRSRRKLDAEHVEEALAGRSRRGRVDDPDSKLALPLPLPQDRAPRAGFCAEDVGEDQHVYEPITCLACRQIHHVNPTTGVVLGEKAAALSPSSSSK